LGGELVVLLFYAGKVLGGAGLVVRFLYVEVVVVVFTSAALQRDSMDRPTLMPEIPIA
jgi:hypothetical protein